MKATILLAPCLLLACAPRAEAPALEAAAPPGPLINVRVPESELGLRRLEIFADAMIHFLPADSLRYETAQVSARDAGRVIWKPVAPSLPAGPVRITARVATRPIPATEQTVHDPWDRAGSVSLKRPDEPAVEILKFVTAYGGATRHEADVSWLAPLLGGDARELRIEGFVDTWTSPGWRMDFALEFAPDPAAENPVWAAPLFNEQNLTRARMDATGGPRVEIEVPAGLARVELLLFVSGHCTDGRGADEFESRDSVLRIDGVERLRVRPWRDDCLQFRAINPYCRRWSDGSWSSDYSRSGWCPGDQVPPLRFELGEFLPPGGHALDFGIEDIRPADASGQGYWRVSALLLGWED